MTDNGAKALAERLAMAMRGGEFNDAYHYSERAARQPDAGLREALKWALDTLDAEAHGHYIDHKAAARVLLATSTPAPADDLDVERLARVLWDCSEAGRETPWIDVPDDAEERGETLDWAYRVAREYRAALQANAPEPAP